MFEDFDEAARQAILQAQEEARQRGHLWVGPEHLLLALLRFPRTAVRPLLRQLDVAPGDVAARIDAAIVSGPPGEVEQRRFDLKGRAVLVASEEQAKALGQADVRSEHLLLALAARDQGVAGTVLRGLGATPDRLRELLRATPDITVRTTAGAGGFRDTEPAPAPAASGTDAMDEAVLRAIARGMGAARERAHGEIEPLHLLLGLIGGANEPGGVGPLFAALDVPVGLAIEVDAALASRPRYSLTEPPALSPASRDVVARAVRARARASTGPTGPLGTGDLLLGLVDKRTGACAKILARAGITEATLRALDVAGAPPAIARAPGTGRRPFGRR